MLIDLKTTRVEDPVLRSIAAAIGGGSPDATRISRGMYEIRHFNFDHILSYSWLNYADNLPGNLESAYGVCDSPQQFAERFGEALDADRAQYVVSFTRIRRDEQPEDGGWRWHKWGPYVGTQEPTCEYLYNEPHIDEVWVFHVYRRAEDGEIGQ